MARLTQNRGGQLYFAQNVEILPLMDFGSLGHTVNVSIERNFINIWVAAIPDKNLFDQSLEIPMELIVRLSITRG
jgi:hypothetical protein